MTMPSSGGHRSGPKNEATEREPSFPLHSDHSHLPAPPNLYAEDSSPSSRSQEIPVDRIKPSLPPPLALVGANPASTCIGVGPVSLPVNTLIFPPPVAAALCDVGTTVTAACGCCDQQPPDNCSGLQCAATYISAGLPPSSSGCRLCDLEAGNSVAENSFGVSPAFVATQTTAVPTQTPAAPTPER